ncbi:MAG: hypothetical protein U9N86_12835 [Bacteroidota bacterium]|nr:hypothetical protein [Bacteroidota bacterium]
MIRFRYFSLVILICSGLISGLDKTNAQDIPFEADEILQKHYAAIGLESKKKINTLISFGALNQLGADLQISIIQKRPSFYRMDVHLNEGRISQGFDGERGWMLNPFVSPDTVAITGPELNQLKESADFDGILVNYHKLGYRITYDAAGIWNERPVLILKLSKESEVSLRFFLDAETYLILKTEARYMINGLPINAQSEFSDYKIRGGVSFPYRIINRNGQLMTEIKIDTIRINEELDDLLFR